MQVRRLYVLYVEARYYTCKTKSAVSLELLFLREPKFVASHIQVTSESQMKSIAYHASADEDVVTSHSKLKLINTHTFSGQLRLALYL